MKEPVLSKRMEMIVSLIPEGLHTIADVGCDHAYISIWIAMNECADNVIAMDVRKGPLEIARKNIITYGQSGMIDVRLSDGFSKLSEGEADAIIIAGMGGLLTKSILEKGDHILHGDKSPILILQPQSDIDIVRHYLYAASYHIENEAMVFEDGKYYTVMRAHPGSREPYGNPEEWTYGRCNIEHKDEVLIEYLNKEAAAVQKIIGRLEGTAGVDMVNDAECGDPILMSGENGDGLSRLSIRKAELKQKYYVNQCALKRCLNKDM